jgi:beta-lactamase class A
MTSDSSLSRRSLLSAGLAAASTAVLTPAVSRAAPVVSPFGRAEGQLRDLERKYAARLGVYARNVRTGQVVTHRADERFAMCSTFKTIAVAAVLRDQDRCARLDKVIHYPPADVLPVSPVTEMNVANGMTVGDLCAAAIQPSDNTAGNLLLRQIGGPAAVTRFFRSIGDPVSRLDRWEIDLNAAVPGDLRDTTTPRAIGRSYEMLVLGRALPVADRGQLVSWLKDTTSAASVERLHAGLPRDWVIADKPGTGGYATANDVGVAWTSEGNPIVLAVLSSKSTEDAPVDNALIADAARILAYALAADE